MQMGEVGLKLQCVRFNFTYSAKEKDQIGAGLFPRFPERKLGHGN